jgi:hypothetical protein
MRDRTWEKRLPKILKALTVDELAYLSALQCSLMKALMTSVAGRAPQRRKPRRL